jgi:hypothetical protein
VGPLALQRAYGGADSRHRRRHAARARPGGRAHLRLDRRQDRRACRAALARCPLGRSAPGRSPQLWPERDQGSQIRPRPFGADDARPRGVARRAKQARILDDG